MRSNKTHKLGASWAHGTARSDACVYQYECVQMHTRAHHTTHACASHGTRVCITRMRLSGIDVDGTSRDRGVNSCTSKNVLEAHKRPLIQSCMWRHMNVSTHPPYTHEFINIPTLHRPTNWREGVRRRRILYSLILKRDPGRLRLNQGASLKTRGCAWGPATRGTLF